MTWVGLPDTAPDAMQDDGIQFFSTNSNQFNKKVPLRRHEVLLPYASGFLRSLFGVDDDGILCINLALGLASIIVTVEGRTLKGIHSAVQLVESLA